MLLPLLFYKKQEPFPQIEMQNTENWNTIDPSTPKQMLTQEDKINVELIGKNHDWKEDYITIPQEPRQEKS